MRDSVFFFKKVIPILKFFKFPILSETLRIYK